MAAATTTTATTTTAYTAHILVFPYPAQGHMPMLLDLTHQLALKGLKITILVTTQNLVSLAPLLTAHPTSIDTLVLAFHHNPKLPIGVENVKDVGNSGNAPIIASLSKLEAEVFEWFKSHPSPPQAIISDFFLGYTQKWASQLNIPRIAFFSVSAFLTSVLDHLWVNIDKLHKYESVEFTDLPMCPSFIQDHLPSIFRKFEKGDSDWEIVKEGMIANSKSWAFVYNSFDALEGEYLDHVRKVLGHERVYRVGPLSPIGVPKQVAMDADAKHGVLDWLDTCPDDSVLYVCFGSQKQLTEPQIEALAVGLERSRTRFVWVIKSTDSLQFPDGFNNRGIVIRGWVPQVEILNHKAVGGFLSHCGWNSLLESLMAGVVLLAWPMEADQFVNAKLLVEYKGLAVKLCEGEHTVPDGDELAQIINKSLGQDIPQKARAKVMKEKALEAVACGGSSSSNLDELVKQLSQIRVSTT